MMKRSLTLLLAIALAACGGVAPPQPTTVATVVVTVIVTQIATQAPPAAPTDTPVPTPTQDISVTVPTNSPTPEITATPTSPPAVGGSVLVDFKRSGDQFSLRCSPSEITFSVTSTSPYVTQIEFYYRTQDKVSSSLSAWENAGKMDTDGKGNYTIVFSALDVKPDLRYAQTWLDFQFVATNKYGDVVARSEKFTKQVTYTIDCP